MHTSRSIERDSSVYEVIVGTREPFSHHFRCFYSLIVIVRFTGTENFNRMKSFCAESNKENTSVLCLLFILCGMRHADLVYLRFAQTNPQITFDTFLSFDLLIIQTDNKLTFVVVACIAREKSFVCCRSDRRCFCTKFKWKNIFRTKH